MDQVQDQGLGEYCICSLFACGCPHNHISSVNCQWGVA